MTQKELMQPPMEYLFIYVKPVLNQKFHYLIPLLQIPFVM